MHHLAPSFHSPRSHPSTSPRCREAKQSYARVKARAPPPESPAPPLLRHSSDLARVCCLYRTLCQLLPDHLSQCQTRTQYLLPLLGFQYPGALPSSSSHATLAKNCESFCTLGPPPLSDIFTHLIGLHLTSPYPCAKHSCSLQSKLSTHLAHPRILRLQTKTKPQTPHLFKMPLISPAGVPGACSNSRVTPPPLEVPSHFLQGIFNYKHTSMRLLTGDVVAQLVESLPSMHKTLGLICWTSQTGYGGACL